MLDDTQGKDPDYFKYTPDNVDNSRHPLMNEEQTLAWFSGTIRRQLWPSKRLASRQSSKVKLPAPLDDGSFILSIDIDGQNAAKAPPEKVSRDDVSKKEQKGVAWSEDQRDKLLGAFFFGYVVAQIPCARSAEILGAKS